jgi:EAL domain-containing protein (putative c-di-GMP-specific phosphodiesterase class I)
MAAGAAGDGSADLTETLGNARAALNRAKAGKIREAVIYSPAIRAEARRRMALERDLRAAVRAEGLEVHYQPIVALSAGDTVGAEALARWRHPELGDISPAEFIPIAESTGLITEVGRWVLTRAIEDQAAWRRAGASDALFVSVNVAPAQLREWTLLEGALNAGQADNARLRIEITEGAMAEHDHLIIDRIRRIGAAGFGLAIDDFGAGYSSFGRLSSLPFSTLKIDRQLTLGIHDQPGRTTLNAIAQLARSLGMDTVVEGIEREDERQWLHAMGFRLGQGYLFGKAVPSSAFIARLSQGAGLALRTPTGEHLRAAV